LTVAWSVDGDTKKQSNSTNLLVVCHILISHCISVIDLSHSYISAHSCAISGPLLWYIGPVMLLLLLSLSLCALVSYCIQLLFSYLATQLKVWNKTQVSSVCDKRLIRDGVGRMINVYNERIICIQQFLKGTLFCMVRIAYDMCIELSCHLLRVCIPMSRSPDISRPSDN